MSKRAHFPHVNRVRRPDGGLYYYHRRTGARLPDDYASPAFAAAWAAEEARDNLPARATQSDPHSYAALWNAFEASGDWARLRDRTRADYGRIRDWMMAQGAGPLPARQLDQAAAEKILDKAVARLGHRQGLYVLQVNRRLYAWALERAARQRFWGDRNPWAPLRPPAKPAHAQEPNRAWTPKEVATTLSVAPVGLRRAYVLGAAGLDGSTMINLTWDDYVDGRLRVVRVKSSVPSVVLVPRVLRPLLEEGPRPHARIITSIPGAPFTLAGLRKRSSEFLRELAAKGLVDDGLTLHGLRHTIGRAIAESGGSLHAIQAALQHRTARMALHYSAEADRNQALLKVADGLDEWFGVQNASLTELQNDETDDEKTKTNNG